MIAIKTWNFPLLESPEEFEQAKVDLALDAFESHVIQPKPAGEGVTFKIMEEEGLDFLERVPVYVNNRLHQSIQHIRELELQLLVWLVSRQRGDYDLISPVPHEADGLSYATSLITGIPHVQPRESKGYGVQKGDYPVDGLYSPGDRILLIEGTSSTLRSIIAEARRWKNRGAQPVRAHAVFTYDWGDVAELKAEGCRFEPILTVREAFFLAMKFRRVTTEEHVRVSKYLLAAEQFFRGEFTRQRAAELDLLRAGY